MDWTAHSVSEIIKFQTETKRIAQVFLYKPKLFVLFKFCAFYIKTDTFLNKLTSTVTKRYSTLR